MIISNIQHEDVFGWRKTAHPLDESAKSLAGILEDQRRAGFKAVMTLQQGPGEEAGHVFGLANVHSDVQGLIQEHRDRFEIRPPLRWFRHGSSLPGGKQRSESATSLWLVERSEPVEVPLPSTAKRFGCPSPQTYQGFPTPPPLRVKGSVPTLSKGVFGLLSWKSDSQVTSPSQYYTNFCSKSRMIPAVYVKSQNWERKKQGESR
jgi:hypothetical protein